MRSDGDDEPGDNCHQLASAWRELSSDADAGPDHRGVCRVAHEEAEHLARVPLEPGGVRARDLWTKHRIDVGHVRDRLHEVEAEPDRRSIEDAVYDVVELVAHDEEEQEHRGALAQLFEQSRRKSARGVEPGS